MSEAKPAKKRAVSKVRLLKATIIAVNDSTLDGTSTIDEFINELKEQVVTEALR